MKKTLLNELFSQIQNNELSVECDEMFSCYNDESDRTRDNVSFYNAKDLLKAYDNWMKKDRENKELTDIVSW